VRLESRRVAEVEDFPHYEEPYASVFITPLDKVE
jgi:hypothetical protein